MYSRDQRPFTITAAATDRQASGTSTSTSTRMPKLYNGVYSGQCGALSPPDLMEAQPKLLPKPRSNRVKVKLEAFHRCQMAGIKWYLNPLVPFCKIYYQF